jgi:hypothetical protein
VSAQSSLPLSGDRVEVGLNGNASAGAGGYSSDELVRVMPCPLLDSRPGRTPDAADAHLRQNGDQMNPRASDCRSFFVLLGRSHARFLAPPVRTVRSHDLQLHEDHPYLRQERAIAAADAGGSRAHWIP